MQKGAYKWKFCSGLACRAAIFTAIFAMASFNCYAQKLSGGTLNFLKGQEKVHVVLDFDNAKLQGKPYKDYLALEDEQWIEGWEQAKSAEFIESLLENLNNQVSGVIFGNYPDAQYRATVNVLTFRRQFRSGVVRGGFGQHLEGAGVRLITCEVVFTGTGNSTPLVKITGLKGDSTISRWIPEEIGQAGSNTYLGGIAFGDAGKRLGKFIAKKTK